MANVPKRKPVGKKPAAMKRYMIRCSVTDLQAWEAKARELGYASAGAWMQRIANQAIQTPKAP